MSYRRLSQQERKLLPLLIKNSNRTFDSRWQTKMPICPMQDGEMGSLKLYPDGMIKQEKRCGRLVSEHTFTDKDNVPVTAALFVDKQGKRYELDMWQVNFMPLSAIDI